MKIDSEFEALYEREFKTVFKAALLFCGDRDAAEDATQDAFVRAYERWERLRGSEWITGWLVTTTINLLKRRLRRRPPLPLPPQDHGDEFGSIDGLMDAGRALVSLPERQREAVVLYYWIDLPVSEVARQMGCAEGTVKAHLAKAREAMAAYRATTGGSP